MNDIAFRTGLGYDVHELVEGRKLILGGVEIPFEKGLLGHSDADCLVHAINDALLGALALGDIGQHFPDTDPQYEGISSLLLMRQVMDLVSKQGYRIGNIDSVIMAQRPKLASYIPAMREAIAHTLGCDVTQVAVKATTTEHLGFVGREEGISCMAQVLLLRSV
ncbi:2-C-methyl-D-erythritol 2,4-cyclodiphosphate synthase [Murdochiella vaginalis]|uniref:2-C-methyl-D-erythritol 2,4-cyclodiphosphate synthase n=1 Tax=Murdochiella vaginalis TaxID=1852373 RepID=UPI0008FE4FE4|nr:2-C-methyl-D-erythritol 2,4-cyclodiphosphate synthase [Murdochiella vaginalis]